MSLPYLTEELPGIGGVMRAHDEDFVVEEEPAYLPSGTGDHVFIKIEKRGLTTPMAAAAIAKALQIHERDIGIAGMKDRRAVTTQWLSLPPPVTPERAQQLELGDIKILEVARHPHKLRTGHVKANRFVLRVRQVRAPDAIDRARAILDKLAEAPGAPNWYGEQRFGRDGDNAEKGKQIVLGGPRPKDKRLARLLVSSLQSQLFNDWLTARIADGHYRDAVAGDILHKRGGGLFDCTEPHVDTPRMRAGEVVATGPMFGDRMRKPADGTDAAAREAEILARHQLESFAHVRAIAEGTRRDAAIEVRDARVEALDGETLEIAFTLPGGAYATVVMREVMKQVDGGPESA